MLNEMLFDEMVETVGEYMAYEQMYVEDETVWDKDGIEVHVWNICNTVYNEDYYIIGTYQATEWIGEHIHDVLEVLEFYQNEYGEPYKDITDVEKLASLTMLILCEQNIDDIIQAILEQEII